jgi:hypothetical protein
VRTFPRVLASSRQPVVTSAIPFQLAGDGPSAITNSDVPVGPVVGAVVASTIRGEDGPHELRCSRTPKRRGFLTRFRRKPVFSEGTTGIPAEDKGSTKSSRLLSGFPAITATVETKGRFHG